MEPVQPPMSLKDLWAFVRQRKIELGWPEADSEELTEAPRNKGLNRTPEKREMLRRIQERCIAADMEPLKAYF